MKKSNIKNIAYLLLFVPFFASAQDDRPYVEPNGLNNWFVELGGSGFFYSLNYEKILAKSSKLGWTGRVGFAYNFTDYTLLNKIALEKNTVMVPFTTSLLYGKRKERLEVGLGFTMIAKGFADREIIPTAVLGFRVIEMNKVFFRVAYTPLIRSGEYIHWYGVSIGRNFSLK